MRKASAEDVEYLGKTNLYTKSPRHKAAQSKKKVISARWIDIDKEDSINENYRSHLVLREIERDTRNDLFAATPPLAPMKVIMLLAAGAIKAKS